MKTVLYKGGAYEVWKYCNTVHFIANYRWTVDVIHKTTEFVSAMWFNYRVPSKIYLNYRFTAQKIVKYQMP